MSGEKQKRIYCRSEFAPGGAREEPEGAAFIQEAHVIVNDHREQARSLYVDPESKERGYAQGLIQQQVRFWGRPIAPEGRICS
ncbi:MULTISPECIES: hypothetical protein, partial [unclassified Pseudomonas]|uniref:hypothetical protein n=1 Tax=unclassified Pseudomonas TaxID=196821 RepID=UPI001C4989D8